MAIHIFSLVIFSIILALSTNLILGAVKKLAATTGLGNYALANTVLAMGTSLPELLIGIQAGLANQPSLSLGNVLGSNIANLSIVIGGACLIGGVLKVDKDVINNDIYYAFLIAAAPLVLLIDGSISRLDGVLLLLLLVFWQTLSLNKGHHKKNLGKRGFLVSLKEKVVNRKENGLLGHIAKLSVGLGVLMFAAHKIIASASTLAEVFEIPTLLVGIFIVGLGSSLPELALEIKAIKNKESEVALGDLLGSIVINSSLIIGITALIKPISLIQPQIYLTTTIFFLLSFFLFYLFIRTRSILERWEGAILLMLYIVMVAIGLF